MAFTQVTVTGTYELADGSPARGFVRFTPRAPMHNENVVVSAPVVATLDGAGAFSTSLAATDDAGTLTADGATATYRVELVLAGQPARSYQIVLGHVDVTRNLADIITVTPTLTAADWLTQTQADALYTSFDAALDDIADLTPSNDDVLQLKGGTWANRTVAQLAADLTASAVQPKDTDLTAIAALAPSNDDVVQRKSGAWTNRTMAQVKTDLALAKGDVGLGSVDNVSAASLRDRSTHTSTQSADTLTDGTTNKAYTATEKTKLSGIATAATANSSDATLLARANHTGTQTLATLTTTGTASASTYLRGDGAWTAADGGHTIRIYVSPTGNNSNPGLVASAPKATIAAAITALGTGYGQIIALSGTHTVPTGGWTINASRHRLHGVAGTKLSATALTTGSAITVTGLDDPPYTQTCAPLADFELIGPGRATTGVTGVTFSAGTGAGSSHLQPVNVNVHDFDIGVTFYSGAYCNNLSNWDVWNCATCINLPLGGADYGERLMLTSCTLFNSGTGVKAVANGGTDMVLLGCSIDYVDVFLNIDNAMITLVGCHLENDSSGTDTMKVTGNVGAIVMLGGLVTRPSGTITNFLTNNSGNGSGAVFNGVSFMGVGNTVSTGIFATGTGRTIMERTLGADIMEFCHTLGANENLLTDGGFEQTTVIDNWTLNGTATTTTSTAQAHSGTRSLAIAKTGSAAVDAWVTLAVPIPPSAKVLISAWMRKPGTEAGTLRFFADWAALTPGGGMTARKTSRFASDSIVVTSTALAWTRTGTGNPVHMAPAWATHVLIILDVGQMAAGTYYWDDVSVTTI